MGRPDRLEDRAQRSPIGNVPTINTNLGAGGFELSDPGFASRSGGSAAADQRDRAGAVRDQPPRHLETEPFDPAGHEISPIAA